MWKWLEDGCLSFGGQGEGVKGECLRVFGPMGERVKGIGVCEYWRPGVKGVRGECLCLDHG